MTTLGMRYRRGQRELARDPQSSDQLSGLFRIPVARQAKPRQESFVRGLPFGKQKPGSLRMSNDYLNPS